VAEAKFAVEEIVVIEPYSPLAEIRDEEVRQAQREARQADVLASVSAFEPTNWTLVRFSLRRSAPLIAGSGQIYRVGHVSLP
jgi:hypothetical protein